VIPDLEHRADQGIRSEQWMAPPYRSGETLTSRTYHTITQQFREKVIMSSPFAANSISHRKLLQLGGGAAAAAVVGTALTSCGKSSSSGQSGSKTLHISYFGTQQSVDALYEGVGKPFETANPGVTVKFNATNGTDWNDYFSKLLTQIAGGTTPDIATVATEGLQLLASKGLAEPLDDYVKEGHERSQRVLCRRSPVLSRGNDVPGTSVRAAH
jgi:hypothetical protein